QRLAASLTRREFMSQTGKLSTAVAAGVILGDVGGTNKQASSGSGLVMMNAYLSHIERLNPKVNAIVSLQPRDGLMKQAAERDAELARGQYRGWMHGFPHSVKDLAATRGTRTTWGSPLLDTVPDYDSIFVERLRRAGVIIMGKTNAPEFGLGSQTYNSVFGTTPNAYDQ